VIAAVMTMAGSDPIAGAGIQADLKVFTALGVYGISVITAITAQNTSGIQQSWPLSSDLVAAQIDSVLSEAKVEVWKSGMLANADIVQVVSQKYKEYNPRILVIDPVIEASDGTALLTPDGIQALKEDLLPLAYLVTPNIKEAEILSGIEIRESAAMREAAQKIYQLGVKNVLVKGGHLSGPAIDLLYDGKDFREYSSSRLSREVHGTGCAFASAIAAELAKKHSLMGAVTVAKEYISFLLEHSFTWGGKKYLMAHPIDLPREIQRYSLVQQMTEALELLREGAIGSLIPEVQSNLGMALPDAKDLEDVAAVPGRIIKLDKSITWIKPPAFGASQHIAQIILTVLRYSPSKRAAMNIRYAPDIIKTAEQLNYTIGSFSREQEPDRIRDQEGKSLAWGVAQVIEQLGMVPDLIYDTGGWGKEAMIRVIGTDAKDVAHKVLALHRAWVNKG
jgi:hydroxymethylpyrimidine/phosphomethylpyrimidine kinase